MFGQSIVHLTLKNEINSATLVFKYLQLTCDVFRVEQLCVFGILYT